MIQAADGPPASGSGRPDGRPGAPASAPDGTAGTPHGRPGTHGTAAGRAGAPAGAPGTPRTAASAAAGAPAPAAGDDAVFAALADPTRRRLLDELSAGGPRSATELAPGYAMSRQAVVKHLAVLHDAGLVNARRDGREVRYALEPARLADATAWLDEVGQRWDRRLDALRRHLAGGAR